MSTDLTITGTEEIFLVLFLTRGMSLRTWDECGLFSREVALYQRLLEHGVHVSFVTYGDSGDLRYAEQLKGIDICCNRWRLPFKLYEWLLPWLHRVQLRRANVVKTNQTKGAENALRCARYWKKPMLARCGYMLSEFSIREQGVASQLARKDVKVEKQVFGASLRIVVTTEEMRQSVVERFPYLAEKTLVIPNYVDIELFAPASGAVAPDRGRICYVGRLNQGQKNIRSLLAAVRDIDVDLDIIGDGPLRGEVEAEARRNSRIHLIGKIANHELPGRLNSSTLFVLPSHYEGHPKALLEAMACGLPVIGTDVPGIRELIDHGRTGLLCGTDSLSLREAIISLLGDQESRLSMGRAAREAVVERFSLDRIVKMELELYSSIVMEQA